MNPFNLRFSYPRRLLTFLVISLLSLVVAGIIMGGIMALGDAEDARLLRIATVVQDVVGFILPALATAVLVSSLPASMLGIDKMFTLRQLILAVALLVATMPVMNMIIDWNASITLPQWASGIEQFMRESEQRAAESVSVMLSGEGAGATLVSVLIVGVLAGVSEELYFRGTMQRLIGSDGVNRHLAIWLTAIIFSIFHFQFFGFFPRVLLGALFGYLLMWSGSIWLPALVHALNNSIYVISERHGYSDAVNQFGLTDIWLVVGSAIVSIVLIISLRKSARQC
ncbi:MAG: CPBP family intramembrane metalloprotease [Muribaculaceae bacterium]|nr:CPBP family intramembrane metalloprotease [Muribaculaceae bacterium]